MFLRGLHIKKSSEKPNCCGGSVRDDEWGGTMFIFECCPSYKQNTFIILALGYKMCSVMSV